MLFKKIDLEKEDKKQFILESLGDELLIEDVERPKELMLGRVSLTEYDDGAYHLVNENGEPTRLYYENIMNIHKKINS